MNSILLIENDTILLDNLIELLELEGYKVKGVSTSGEAEAAIHVLKPYLIICDENTLNNDSGELIETLRAESQRNISIIIINSEGGTKRLFEGADIYLEMPFQEEKLLSSLDYLAGIGKAQ